MRMHVSIYSKGAVPNASMVVKSHENHAWTNDFWGVEARPVSLGKDRVTWVMMVHADFYTYSGPQKEAVSNIFSVRTFLSIFGVYMYYTYICLLILIAHMTQEQLGQLRCVPL